MSVQDQLQDELARAGARVAGHPGDLDAIKRRGRRHRNERRLASALAAVTLLAAGGLLVEAVTGPTAPPTPVVGEGLAPGAERSIRVCEAAVGSCTEGASTEDLAALRDALDGDPDVHRAEFLGQEATVAEYERRLADEPALLDALDRAVLPSEVRVTLAAGTDGQAFAARYGDAAGVAEVVPARLDRPRIVGVVPVEEEVVWSDDGTGEVDPADPPEPGLAWDATRQAWLGTVTRVEVLIEPVAGADAYTLLVDGVPRSTAAFPDGPPPPGSDVFRIDPADLEPGTELTVVALVQSRLPAPLLAGSNADATDPRVRAAVVSRPSPPVTHEPTGQADDGTGGGPSQ
jgi:hypothetical protein